MAGTIPRNFIDDLTIRVDIVDLIHTRVPLKKAGREYIARCPFHNEKTPSFSVSREKQVYHCFGCGASGDAIHFLAEFEHLSFVESVEILATMQGLMVPRGVMDPAFQAQQQTLKNIYILQEKVATFFSVQLRHHTLAPKVIAYLKHRGMSGKIAARYGLGFAPPGWHNLVTKFEPELLLQAGLIKKKENSGQPYDHFRDRLMFPIKDRQGRILGFGGRVLDDSLPKYLNSPETDAFRKGKQVYGLYQLLQTVSKPERILVVEGYMDVIAMVQYQIPYTVATLGTAATEEQINLLFRHTAELVFCFDGDKAGRKASWRALQNALPCLLEGRQIRFMVLPNQQDPDSLVRSEGSTLFQKRIAEATLLSDYFFSYLAVDLDLQKIEGRSQLLNSATPLIKRLPAGVFQQMMQEKLKEWAKIPILSSIEFASDQTQTSRRSTHVTRIRRTDNRVSLPSSMQLAITMLLQNPGLSRTINSKLMTLLPTMSGGALFVEIVNGLQQAQDTEAIIKWFQGHPKVHTVVDLARKNLAIPTDGIEAEFCGACLRLLEQGQKKRLDDLVDKASRTEGLKDNEKIEIRELLLEVKR